jgi:predicted RNA-binding Zn ribbon-like protein
VVTEKDAENMASQDFLSQDFLWIADHPALDLLNTVPKVDGELVDALLTDDDVRRWLAKAGFPVGDDVKLRPMALLRATQRLRQMVRTGVEERKSGKVVDVGPLNAFLSECESHLELMAGPKRTLRMDRRWKAESAEGVLAPVAEAAADLLTNGDFELVRLCEDGECVLWFYDRTKSHHRRWCSMASCGNRNKVAAFRERQLRQD